MANTPNSILLLVLQEHLDLTVQSYFLEVTSASRVRPCFLALLVITASNYSLAKVHSGKCTDVTVPEETQYEKTLLQEG